tara:strand:- start:2282 stop:2791 length:510 start_codon:yes stop_codon:yes gene_type:complete
MKKIIYLMSLSLALYSCEAPKSVTTTTVTNEDNKSIAIAKLMKGYVENNFDGGIIAENCIVRFNNIELGKKDFEGLAPFHHSMFDNIKFPDGWIETVEYHGENWKEGNGQVWTNQWTEWTATSKISGETHSNRSHFNYKWENEKIVEINALFSDLWYDKEVKAYMEKQK